MCRKKIGQKKLARDINIIPTKIFNLEDIIDYETKPTKQQIDHIYLFCI